MRTATLTIVNTSPTCTRYQLVENGKVIWSNRVSPVPAGHEGARTRLAAWALAHGIRTEQARRPPAELATAEVRRR